MRSGGSSRVEGGVGRSRGWRARRRVSAAGDLNTDPGRLAGFDPSADRWLDFVGEDRVFRWVSPIGPDALTTYAGGANIDHVASDTLHGDCLAPTVTPGHGAFTDIAFFDHLPLVCALSE